MIETTVPREKVVQIVESYRQLLHLKIEQHATMALMIRGCIAKIRQDYKETPAYRRAQGLTASNVAMREHKREQDMAFLHLEWLATQLENEAGTLDVRHEPVIIEAQ